MAKEKIDPHAPILSTEQHAREPNERELTLLEGKEIVSPLPMEPPLGYVKRESLADQIHRMVRSEQLRLAAEQAGMETFEEAEDFDVGDDYEPHSPWENEYDPSLSELVTAGREALAAKAAKAPSLSPAPSAPSGAPATAAPASGDSSPSEPAPPVPQGA